MYRHMRLSADLNNMSWRVRPEELLLEVGKQFSSKINLHQAISDMNVSNNLLLINYDCTMINYALLYNCRISDWIKGYVADRRSAVNPCRLQWFSLRSGYIRAREWPLKKSRRRK